MCGICGKIDTSDVGNPDALAPMIERLYHRGPDRQATHLMKGCAFGHTRLSIIDLSERGDQPMLSPDGDMMLVFNGEIYNHRDLRCTLEEAGFRFSSRSDTEALLHGYAHWGTDVVDHLDGMFAFAIWDARRNRLFAARDPLGKKPFVWYRRDRALWFASDIVSLLAGLPERPGLRLEAVEAYLRYRYVPGNTSVYAGVEKLPPGHALTYEPLNDEGPVLRRYWRPRYRRDAALTTDTATEMLRPLIVAAVAKRMESDVPLAALLSGGLDSSLIVAIGAKELGVRWNTIGVSFENDPEDESPYARAVAADNETRHEQIELSADFLDELPRVRSFFSEPYADDGAVPSYVAYKALKRHATVAVTGDGGDEIFAGYLHSKGFYWHDKLGPFASIGRASSLGSLFPGYRRSRTLRQAVSLGRYVGLDGPSAFALTRGTAWGTDAAALIRDTVTVDPYLENAYASTEADDDFEKSLVADMLTTLPDAYLLKVDRASMASSVEVRCPLLDRRLVEAAQTVPRGVLMAGGRTKSLQMHIARDYLPADVIDRPKRGFSVPLASFLRRLPPGVLTRLFTDEHSFSRQHLDTAVLDRTLEAFIGGQDNLSYRLWSILCLEIWYRLHFLQTASADHRLSDLV